MRRRRESGEAEQRPPDANPAARPSRSRLPGLDSPEGAFQAHPRRYFDKTTTTTAAAAAAAATTTTITITTTTTTTTLFHQLVLFHIFVPSFDGFEIATHRSGTRGPLNKGRFACAWRTSLHLSARPRDLSVCPRDKEMSLDYAESTDNTRRARLEARVEVLSSLGFTLNLRRLEGGGGT